MSLRATAVPDFGDYDFNVKVVTRASRTLCVDPVKTPAFHTTDSNLFTAARCAELQLPGVSRAVPLTTAYHFSWPASHLLVDNNYYLNVSARPAAGEIDVTGGLADADFQPLDPAMEKLDNAGWEWLKKALADAARQGEGGGGEAHGGGRSG